MTPLTARERALLTTHLCFETMKGTGILERVFTTMALVYGRPSWGRTIEWVNKLEPVLGIPANTFTVTEGDQWLKHYEEWYSQQENKLAERNQVREV